MRPRTLENIVPGVFTPVLAKHSKSFSLVDCVSVGVDRMQQNFEPMRKQVEAWQRSEFTDATAKVVIYEVFVGGRTGGSKTPCPDGTRSVLRTEVRRVPAANDLEAVERLHVCIQGTDAHCPV